MADVQPVAQCEEAPFFGVPPSLPHVRVTEGMAVNGKRVIVSDPDGFWPDNRAVGNTYRDARGILRVLVIPEVEWYRWMDTPPGTILPYEHTQSWPADLVYID